MSLIARRSFLFGVGAALATPAIVHAGNIMPVSGRMLIERAKNGLLGEPVAWVRIFNEHLEVISERPLPVEAVFGKLAVNIGSIPSGYPLGGIRTTIRGHVVMYDILPKSAFAWVNTAARAALGSR